MEEPSLSICSTSLAKGVKDKTERGWKQRVNKYMYQKISVGDGARKRREKCRLRIKFGRLEGKKDYIEGGQK